MNRTKHFGMTLIEILIGITLGAILTIGMVNVLTVNKQIMRMTKVQNTLQENISFTEFMLDKIVMLAGYRSEPSTNVAFTDMDTIFPPNSTPFIEAENNTGNNGADILTVRFQGSGDGLGNPDNTIEDCTGKPVDANAMATNIFSITNNNELQCRAINTTTDPASDSTIVLVENVENLQVLFGEDTTGDGYANRYVNPGYSDLNHAKIVAARFALLFTSENLESNRIDSKTYTLLDNSFNPPDDYRLRQLITKTIQIRNQGESA